MGLKHDLSSLTFEEDKKANTNTSTGHDYTKGKNERDDFFLTEEDFPPITP